MNSTPSSELLALRPALSVGVLAGGHVALRSNLELLERSGVPLVHIDVMDGEFCSVRAGSVADVADIETRLLKDVHLMVADPTAHVAAYARAGAGLITVHAESRDPAAALRAIAAHCVRRGLAILPTTPIEALLPFVDVIDVVLVLGVIPGERERDPAALSRVSAAAALVHDRGVLVAFDGGVTADDVGALAAAGADLIVSGSAIFSGGRAPEEVLATMQGQLR
jgi:ribulose-phosphate 3-epimerase